MLRSGTDVLAGVLDLPHGFGSADDLVIMPLQAGTQWDGLGHVFDRGRMWNGYSAGEVSAFLGATRNGIQNLKSHLVTRGVLLDVARLKGVESLEPGYAITEDDLLTCIESQGPTSGVSRGDAVLVRTGQLGVRRRDGWGTYVGGECPGLDFQTAGWLHRTEIAALACDNSGVEVRPYPTGCVAPLHQVMIPNIGLTIGETFALDELGEACAADGCYEFLFVGGPLPISNAVGSPANPQAVR
jgi:kynurenine formamidase